MNTKTTRNLIVTSVACLMTLIAGNAMAFGISVAFNDALHGGAQSGESDDGGSGFNWWSKFQSAVPESRLPEIDSLPNIDRSTGAWFEIRRAAIEGHSGGRVRFSVASLGIDRHARIAFAKDRFLKNFVFGWRFNRWFTHRDASPPAAIPLPAPLLLLGSALAGLITFTRRSLRRKEGRAAA